MDTGILTLTGHLHPKIHKDPELWDFGMLSWLSRPSRSMDWRASESCGFVNCLANSPRFAQIQRNGRCWMLDVGAMGEPLSQKT